MKHVKTVARVKPANVVDEVGNFFEDVWNQIQDLFKKNDN